MEKVLELYKYIDGVNDAKFPNDEEQVVVRDFRYDAKRMGGAPTISFSIKHSLCLDNLWDDHVYAMFNGERYYVKQTPTSSYSNEDTRYKHEVELISERTILDNVYFYDVVTTDVENDKHVSNSSKFSFFGDIHEYVKRVGYSLSWSGLDYTIEIDENIVSEEKQVSFENQVITSVLQEIYNIYKIPYYFDGKVIHVGYYQNNIDHVFKYGAQNSLLSISKTNANAKIVNRITGVGSQDNIPYYYPNDDEKGITRPLLNDSTSGVQIVSASKYRKIRLSDRFIFNKTIQATTSLIDENNYTLGDLRIGSFQDEKSKFIVDFLYSFTLKQGENVEFSVTSSYDDNVGLSYDMYKKGGNYIGPFVDSSQMYLSSGEYSFVVRWSFMAQGTMIEIEENLPSLIATYLNIRAHLVIDAENTWTLNGIPVSLENYGLQVDSPNDGDVVSIEQTSYINPQSSLMPSIYRETLGQERFYNALNDTYVDEENGGNYIFENEYSNNHPKEHIEDFEDIKPSIKNVTNNDGFRIDRFVDFAYDLYDNDEVDEEGKFIHKWFFAKLNKLDGENGFNLFDHAIDESEMIISMTSGSCGSCSFKVLVNKETQKNTVQVDEYGNLLRDNNGNVRFGSPQDRQNDTENYEVWIALEKDIQTFGVIMPNATNNYRPSAGDTFVILHIDLPKSYIEAAEKKLENELIKYMYENNFEKFNFSISFSRIFFAEQPNILANLTENSKLNVEYNGNVYELYVSSLSYAMNSSHPLPEIKVELDDVIAISQNQISQIVASTRKEILAVSNQDVFWKDIKGVPSWITSEKPQYSYNELHGRSTQHEDGVWVVKTDANGSKYIFSTYPVVTQYGITMYADGGDLDIPSIYNGLPIDNETLYWENVDGSRVLKAKGGEGGGGLTEVYWDDVKMKPTFALVATSGKYADLSGLPDLSVYATTEYLTSELKKYVTLNTEQTIGAHKNFLNGLSIGGLPITKSQDDVIYLDANLVVRGGITMYSDNTVDVGTIFDALPIDGNTIFWENGVLKANVTEGVITNITSDMVVEALGFTPYNASNPKGYISGITSAMIVSALGYTPLQSHQTIYALTIQKNGTNIGTYTPNSAKKTINIVVPTKVSELDNDEEYATTSDLDSRIDALINGAPTAFDTLKEIADVLQGNVNSIGDIITTLGTKADKAIKISAGTGLSGGGTLEADRTLSLATSGVTAGTYKSVDVDKYGRVTSGTNPTTLAGYGITDAYTKSAVDALLGNYVTLATKQTITGEKNFTGGLKVNGSPIVYDATNKYWKLEGDLLVTGGVTMYASDSAFTPSTIMDAIATDGVNLKVVDGVLTFVGQTGGGVADSVLWDNVEGKPSWIGFSKPSYSYSEISGTPTLLSSFHNDLEFVSKGTTLSHYGITNAIGYLDSIIADKADAYNLAGYGTTGGGFPVNGGAIKVGINNYQMILHGRHDTLRFNTVEAGTLKTWRKVWHDGNFNPSDYLPLSGGVINGRITTEGRIVIRNSNPIQFDRGDNKEILLGLYSQSSNDLYYYNGGTWGKVWTAENDGAGSGLDADLLDGYDSSNFIRCFKKSIDINTPINDNNAPFILRIGSLSENPNTPYLYANILHVSNTGSDTAFELLGAYNYDRLLFRRGTWNAYGSGTIFTNPWKTIAFTDSNVASATKLETARTIWGQSFDGSGDVSGTLTLGYNSIIGGGDEPILGQSTGGYILLGLGTSKKGFDTYIDGYNTRFRYGTASTEGMRLTSSGNVLIGTTTDSGYKLDVNGGIACSGIMRIERSNDANTYLDISMNDGNANYNAFDHDDKFGSHTFMSNGEIVFRVHGFTKNVGVGFSNPTYKLDVNGDIHSTTNVRTPIATIDGIPIYKSQDDVLYIDGNLAVRGGVTMYATDAIDVPSIIDALPIASASAKGIAAFNPNDFSIVDGYVSFIGLTDKGFASTLGELANVGAWADSAPSEGRLLYQAAGSEKWSSISFSELPSGTSGDAKRLCSAFGSSVSGDTNDRPISANGIYTDKSLRYYLATGNMATGKPMADGMILHGAWDNSGWNSQLFLPNNDSASMQHRSMRSGLDTTWGDWKTLLDSSNYSSYALSLNGGTLNGDIRIVGSIYYENIIHIENYHENTDTFVACSRPDKGNTIRFGVGAGGENRGIWDNRLNKWLCYADNNGFNITNNTWISHDEWNNALILYRRTYGGGSAIDVRNSSGGVGAFGVNGNKEFEFAPYVNGQIASRMTIDQNGNGLFHGGITMYSDIRKKTKLQDVELTLQQIADAPLIEHYYNSDAMRTTHVGSIAQYWAGLNDWFCKLDNDGYYTMEIQNAALASAISIARELVKYESKTDKEIRMLKDEVKRLKKEIKILKSA